MRTIYSIRQCVEFETKFEVMVLQMIGEEFPKLAHREETNVRIITQSGKIALRYLP